MFWGLHDFLCYQSKDGGLWKYPFWIQGSCETWWKWQCFHSFFRGEVKMYFGNWFYCVRKPRRNSLKTSYIKRKGVLTWKCVVKACTSYTFKNFCRIYVWFSSSLIYLGNIRKKKKRRVGLTSLGYPIPTQNRVFSYPTSSGFVGPAFKSPGLIDLWSFCCMHLDSFQPVTWSETRSRKNSMSSALNRNKYEHLSS